MFSVFELVGDIGGMQTILLTVVGFIMTAYHYQRFELYMTQKLYKRRVNVFDKQPKPEHDVL